jgi:DNA-directed RNA polymerase subunit RPC12/RpoP
MRCPDCNSQMAIVVDEVFYTSYVCIDCQKEHEIRY